MIKSIRSKLHKIFFSDFEEKHVISVSGLEKEVEYQKGLKELYLKQLKSVKQEIVGVRKNLSLVQSKYDLLKNTPSATMSDLMRDILGVLRLDFLNVEEDGAPKHFLNTDDKVKRTMYLTQLAQIWNLEVWHEMVKNHIDTQGNFSFRKADGELQMLCGRMTVNGISLLNRDVKKGYEEYTEGRKPAEDFDEFETTEGIIINKG